MEISPSECPDFYLVGVMMGKFYDLYETEDSQVSSKLLIFKVQRSQLCRSSCCFIQNKPSEKFICSRRKPVLHTEKKIQTMLSHCRCTPTRQEISFTVASPRLYTLHITLLCFSASGEWLSTISDSRFTTGHYKPTLTWLIKKQFNFCSVCLLSLQFCVILLK